MTLQTPSKASNFINLIFSRKINNSVQAETGRNAKYDTDSWFQCRNYQIQENEFERLGRWWTGFDSFLVETLLHGHKC